MQVVNYNGFRFVYNEETESSKYFAGWVKEDGVRRKIRLHQYKWLCERGEVPEGYHIHHKDGNRLNNDIENLECISGSEHLSIHGNTEKRRISLRDVQPLGVEAAKEWHRSEEGSKWHSEHAKKAFANKPFRKITCGFCNKEYETNAIVSKFCSNNCKSANRRKISKETGLDMEDRKCKTCDNVFNINKYSLRALCRDCYNYGCNTKYKVQ